MQTESAINKTYRNGFDSEICHNMSEICPGHSVTYLFLLMAVFLPLASYSIVVVLVFYSVL